MSAQNVQCLHTLPLHAYVIKASLFTSIVLKYLTNCK